MGKVKHIFNDEIKVSADTTTSVSSSTDNEKYKVKIKVITHLGSSHIHYNIQQYVQKNKGTGLVKSEKIRLKGQGDPKKDCSNEMFKEFKQPIYAATITLINAIIIDFIDNNGKYSISDCEHVLDSIPSSLLRSNDVYDTYLKLVDLYSEQITNSTTNAYNFNPEKIANKNYSKRLKIKNKYIQSRLDYLENYLNRYKDLENTYLEPFEEKLSKGEIKL